MTPSPDHPAGAADATASTFGAVEGLEVAGADAAAGEGALAAEADAGAGEGAAAARAWDARVRANRAQAERVREEIPADFYGTTSHRFRVDPRRADDPTLDALLELARPDETWLDVGAGAGRFALPLALRVREVIALDPSPAMLAGLGEGMASHGIANVRVIQGRWPREPGAAPLRADVSLLAHVGYDIEGIGAFLDALEAATERLCVAVMTDPAPSSPASVVWPAVHGEERLLLPALPEFTALLRARGAAPTLRIVERAPRVHADRAEAHAWLGHQCFIAPDGAADGRLAAAVAALPSDAAGRITMPVTMEVGVVTWVPRH